MPVAVVTGGSRGIGLAIARELAGRGFAIALGARSIGELEAARAAIARDFSIQCVAQETDVSDPEQAQRLVDRARAELGGLDVVVNNAGINGAIGELTKLGVEEWRSAIEVNLLGTVYVTRAAIPASARNALTSLTRPAPAAIAASATASLDVSTEICGRAGIGSVALARPAITGRTRRSSSAANTGSAPGRVDSPPTSRISAPSAASRSPCAIASSGRRKRPPSENESGVTLTMPIRRNPR